MTEIDVSTKQDGGVLKTITKEGQGEALPSSGNEVIVHYTGSLVDGTVFDSSRGRGEFKFTLGEGQVIKGWEEGVKTMKNGEISTFKLAPEYAYGANGSPPKIGPNETLVFDIELIGWKPQDISEEGDGRLTRSVIKPGRESWTKVCDGSQCTITCKMLKDVSLDLVHNYGTVKFEVGEAELHNLPAGVDFAVKKMQRNEVAHIICKLNMGLSDQSLQTFNLESQEDLVFELGLKNYEKVNEPWEMSDEEKINQATICKEKGTQRFKEKQYKIACTHYSRVLELLAHQETKTESDDGPKITEQFTSLKLAANLNLALVYPKYDENYKAIAAANNAIEIDPNNEKAYYRRGDAHTEVKDYTLAKNDFKKVLEINKENKSALKKIKLLAERIKKEKENEKSRYAGKLFG